MLPIEAMKKRKLLRPMHGIIHGIEVERQRQRRLGERGDELLHEQREGD